MSNSKLFSIFLSLSVVALSLSSSVQLVRAQCRPEDKATLLKIKSGFGYSSSLATWKNDTDCCFFWDGVICDVFTYKIIYLWITNSNTSGPIPSTIGDLPDLRRLNILNHPNLTGPLPRSLTKLTNLERLAITGTSLSGSIPNMLCSLSILYSLDLSANNLSGRIPGCFSGSVHIINFSDNQLTGRIPRSLLRGYGGNDTELNLRNNHLAGTIPESFSTLNFQNLDLSENYFVGDASFIFGRSKFSVQIDLSNNRFNFDLSPVTYPMFLNLLDISHNKIRGRINEQITELQGLGVLDMSYNRLCGPIPSGGMMRPYDKSSFVGNKCLCGTPLPPCTA